MTEPLLTAPIGKRTRLVVISGTTIVGLFSVFLGTINVAHGFPAGAVPGYYCAAVAGCLTLCGLWPMLVNANAAASLLYMSAAVLHMAAAVLLIRIEGFGGREPFYLFFVCLGVCTLACGAPALKRSLATIRRVLHQYDVPRILGVSASVLAAFGSYCGTYFYYTGPSSAIQTGDRSFFIGAALLSGVLLAASRWKRWIAALVVPVVVLALYVLSPYPITKNLKAFWGQALAMGGFVVTLLSVLAIFFRGHSVEIDASQSARNADCEASGVGKVE